MNSIKTEKYEIKTPRGWIYAKKWIPENLSSDIPVILLHDSLGSVDLWRDFPEALAAKLSRYVIAYDRLGFGKSDARAQPPAFDFIEQEATHYFPLVKDGLSLTGYILFGHSVGGAIAVNIAARDAACAAVITVASQAFVEDLTVDGIERAMEAFKQPGQIDRLKKYHGEKAEWVLSGWADIWLSTEFSDWSLDSIIGKVSCPVLVIHGDSDEYGSKAFPEFIAGKTGGPSEILMLQNCGHLPHREKPGEVIAAVDTFLDKHLAKKAEKEGP